MLYTTRVCLLRIWSGQLGRTVTLCLACAWHRDQLLACIPMRRVLNHCVRRADDAVGLEKVVEPWINGLWQCLETTLPAELPVIQVSNDPASISTNPEGSCNPQESCKGPQPLGSAAQEPAGTDNLQISPLSPLDTKDIMPLPTVSKTLNVHGRVVAGANIDAMSSIPFRPGKGEDFTNPMLLGIHDAYLLTDPDYEDRVVSHAHLPSPPLNTKPVYDSLARNLYCISDTSENIFSFAGVALGVASGRCPVHPRRRCGHLVSQS